MNKYLKVARRVYEIYFDHIASLSSLSTLTEALGRVHGIQTLGGFASLLSRKCVNNGCDPPSVELWTKCARLFGVPEEDISILAESSAAQVRRLDTAVSTIEVGVSIEGNTVRKLKGRGSNLKAGGNNVLARPLVSYESLSENLERRTVFLSFSMDDGRIAADLSDCCGKLGADVWCDWNIPPGDDWQERLRYKIAACAYALVLVSAQSRADSRWRDFDLSFICERKWSQPDLQLVVLRLGDVPIPACLSEYPVLDIEPDNVGSVSRLAFTEGQQSEFSVVGPVAATVIADRVGRFQLMADACRQTYADDSSSGDSR